MENKGGKNLPKKVTCSICGDRFLEKDAKYEPAVPAYAGIYTLCPTCYPKFMKAYRPNKAKALGL